MRYPVAITKHRASCYGITVPDISECVSDGKTIDDAFRNAEEVISIHLSNLAESGIIPPKSSSVSELIDHPDYKGVVWAYIEINVSRYLGKSEKTTITLPAILIKKIDDAVHHGAAKTRSAFLADSALTKLVISA